MTANLKFEKFIELIFNSKMKVEEVKEEIVLYVKALETNYTDTIKELREHLDKEKVKFKKLNFEKIVEVTDKN